MSRWSSLKYTMHHVDFARSHYKETSFLSGIHAHTITLPLPCSKTKCCVLDYELFLPYSKLLFSHFSESNRCLLNLSTELCSRSLQVFLRCLCEDLDFSAQWWFHWRAQLFGRFIDRQQQFANRNPKVWPSSANTKLSNCWVALGSNAIFWPNP